MPTKEIIELGVAGIALMVVWKVLDFAKMSIVAKRANNGEGHPVMSPLACQADPLHFGHIKDSHEMLSEIKQGMDSGKLGCYWQGRDEIRDLLELMRSLLTEIKGLRSDMRAAEAISGEGKRTASALGDLMGVLVLEIQGLRKDMMVKGRTRA